MQRTYARTLITRSTRAAITTSLALALYAAIPEPAQAETGAITARNAASIRTAFDSWTAGTGNVFSLLSPNIKWTVRGSGPIAREYNGINDFIEHGAKPLTSRLRAPLVPRVHHIWAHDDQVIIRFDASSTTTAGHPYNNAYVWIFRMNNDVVVEAEAFLDLDAYQQVVANNPAQ